MASKNEPLTKSMPALERAGIPHIAATGELGIGMQPTAPIVLAGASPHAITFAELVGLNGAAIRPPRDGDYSVVLSGNSEAKLDHTAKTTTGFSLIGGSAADVVSFVIFGAWDGLLK